MEVIQAYRDPATGAIFTDLASYQAHQAKASEAQAVLDRIEAMRAALPELKQRVQREVEHPSDVAGLMTAVYREYLELCNAERKTRKAKRVVAMPELTLIGLTTRYLRVSYGDGWAQSSIEGAVFRFTVEVTFSRQPTSNDVPKEAGPGVTTLDPSNMFPGFSLDGGGSGKTIIYDDGTERHVVTYGLLAKVADLPRMRAMLQTRGELLEAQDAHAAQVEQATDAAAAADPALQSLQAQFSALDDELERVTLAREQARHAWRERERALQDEQAALAPFPQADALSQLQARLEGVSFA